MPYHDRKQQPAPEENKKARPEELFDSKQRSFGMPNSLMQAVPMTSPGTPNSVMREMDADDSGALFRGRGFDPGLGVHESSHTVRRASVAGPVRQTVSSGTIQRIFPNPDEEDDFGIISGGQINASQLDKDRALWAQMKKSGERGASAAKKNVIAAIKAAAEADKRGQAQMNAFHGVNFGGSSNLNLGKATNRYVNGSVVQGEEEKRSFLDWLLRR